MKTENQTLVENFIEQVWNQQNFELVDEFLHPNFTDNSLPPSFTPDKQGLENWIKATSSSFAHKTIIEDQVTEGEKSIIKIRMEMKHIGTWRNIEATGVEVVTNGYRFYKISDGKIIEHSALIDGQTIENKLTNAFKGCKIN
ncbi:MAG: ester cyclase [Daejeonella sp.]|nr:ester cyclase [Daejeonella sp.]